MVQKKIMRRQVGISPQVLLFFFFSILFSKGSQQIEIKIEAKNKSNGILSYFYTTVHHFRAQGL